METDRRVIRLKDLPSRPPIFSTAVIWLLLDRFELPGWFHGVVWTLVALIWIAVIYAITTEKHTPVAWGADED